MKSYLKSILSFCFMFIMLCTIVACGEDKDDKNGSNLSSFQSELISSDSSDNQANENILIGKWSGEMTADEDVLVYDTVSWKVTITFDDSGKYELLYDAESYVDAMIEGMKKHCETQNIAIEDYLAATSFSSFDEYREETMNYFTDHTFSGIYEYDENVLKMDDMELDFEWDGDLFIFKGDVRGDDFEVKIKKVY